MLGAAVVRQLVTAGYTVVAVDIAAPQLKRKVNGVVYIACDLAKATPETSALSDAFAGCAAVVHTAGVVRMGSDTNSETLLHNAHIVATVRKPANTPICDFPVPLQHHPFIVLLTSFPVPCCHLLS